MNESTRTTDRKEILDHIHGIFQAFLRQDRDAIRRSHTDDWTGFQGPSTQIERGIEAYMKNAEASLKSLRGISYELHDTEVQFYGDLALVYYVASYRFRNHDGHEGTLPLRSVDIYRRESDGWNQAGSHISVIPSQGTWRQEEHTPETEATASGDGEQVGSLSQSERERLLADREAVWRAWFQNDHKHLRAALGNELVAIDPGIEPWSNKKETLAAARKFATEGSMPIRLEFPRTEIQVFGNVAILYTTYLFEIETGGERKTTRGRGTEIFVKRDGAWVNVGWHLDSGS